MAKLEDTHLEEINAGFNIRYAICIHVHNKATLFYNISKGMSRCYSEMIIRII